MMSDQLCLWYPLYVILSRMSTEVREIGKAESNIAISFSSSFLNSAEAF